MIQRLERIDREMDVRLNLFNNKARAILFGSLATAELDPIKRLGFLRQQAGELLKDGQSMAAVTQYREIAQIAIPGRTGLGLGGTLRALPGWRDASTSGSTAATRTGLLAAGGDGEAAPTQPDLGAEAE